MFVVREHPRLNDKRRVRFVIGKPFREKRGGMDQQAGENFSGFGFAGRFVRHRNFRGLRNETGSHKMMPDKFNRKREKSRNNIPKPFFSRKLNDQRSVLSH